MHTQLDPPSPGPAPYDRLTDEQKQLATILLMACGHIAVLGDVSVSRAAGRTTITLVFSDEDVLVAG